jgi:hypothetical protein
MCVHAHTYIHLARSCNPRYAYAQPDLLTTRHTIARLFLMQGTCDRRVNHLFSCHVVPLIALMYVQLADAWVRTCALLQIITLHQCATLLYPAHICVSYCLHTQPSLIQQMQKCCRATYQPLTCIHVCVHQPSATYRRCQGAMHPSIHRVLFH